MKRQSLPVMRMLPSSLPELEAIRRELEALEAALQIRPLQIKAFEAANAGKVIDELKAR